MNTIADPPKPISTVKDARPARPRDILFCGPVAWDGAFQRPHHFIRRLSRDRRVLWVNPGLLLEVPRWIAEPIKLAKTGRAYFRTERTPMRLLYTPPEMPNVRVLTVLAPLPFSGRYPLAHTLNARAVALQIRAALRRFPLSEPVFLAQHPKALALANQLGLQDIIYDCLDDLAAFPGWHDGAVIEQYENDLFRQASLVTVSSKILADRAVAAGAAPLLLPNGVELSWFRRDTPPRPVEKPPGARVFGFVGAIYEWIDLELIEALARTRPKDLVVLVGPIKASLTTEIARLQALPNVRLVGSVPHREVATWIAAFDVCLLPFKRNRLTESVNPLKLYEYFALGRPCLAASIPEIACWGEVVALADTPAQLPAALAEIQKEWDDPVLARQRADRRVEIAGQHAWDAITERMVQWTDSLETAGKRVGI